MKVKQTYTIEDVKQAMEWSNTLMGIKLQSMVDPTVHALTTSLIKLSSDQVIKTLEEKRGK